MGTLYRYEMKKLLSRKMVWITLLLCLIITTFSAVGGMLGSYYVDGVKADTHFNMYQTDLAYQKALAGRKIDQSLLDEMAEGYGRIPKEEERYSTTEEYQKYARPYSAIFSFVRIATNMTVSETREWTVNEKELYEKRLSALMGSWEDAVLTKNEKSFWLQKEAEIKTPFTYAVTESYFALLRAFTTIGLVVLLSVAICLSGIFTEEHTRKTDQLILCSAYGKNAAYWAKILAGVSFAAFISLTVSGVAFLLVFCLYGGEGFDAAFQLLYYCSYPITAGEAILTMYGILMITAVLTGVSVMVLSERLRSNIATLAVAAGFLLLGMMFSVPMQYRVPSQIWDWFPNCILNPENIFDVRLLPVFGKYFTAWQAIPVIYLAAVILLVFIGKPIYQRFQVSGR